MPSTLITTREGWIDDAEALIDAVQAAFVESIVTPTTPKTLRLLELPAKAIPLPRGASGRYIVIEISLLPGRTPEQKQALYAAVPRHLARFGVLPGDIKVILYEVTAENWS